MKRSSSGDHRPSGYRHEEPSVHAGRKSPAITVRFASGVLDGVRKASSQSGRSFNSEVNALLSKALGLGLQS